MSNIQQGIAKKHPEWILPRLCQRKAYKTGIYTAVFAGFLVIPLVRRLQLDKNKVLFAALGTSSIAGYISSKYTYHYCQQTQGFLEAVHHFPNKAT